MSVLGPEYAEWLDRLAAIRPAALRWPDAAAVRARLGELGLQPEDQQVAEATTVAVQGQALEWVLSRLLGHIKETMGDEQADRLDLPAMPESLGDAGRCLPLHAFVLAAPETAAYHRRLGISPEITRATLNDLGRHVARYRLMFGTTGVAGAGFMLLHFRGLLFECGRLQYQPITPTGSEVETQDQRLLNAGQRVRQLGGPKVGEPVLSVHIPEAGPLLPEAVDRSLERVSTEVVAHLPGPRRRFAVCFSWLLDDQLASYLPATSNIIRFQRRFRLVPDWWADGDYDILRFVFRRPSTPPEVLAELPQRTTLERAVVDHLRRGEHWRVRAGWLALA